VTRAMAHGRRSRTVRRCVGLVVIGLVTGAASTVALALQRAHALGYAACASRERVRFPGPIPPALRAAQGIEGPGQTLESSVGGQPIRIFVPDQTAPEPLRCGLVVTVERRFGALDIRVQSGAIIRTMDGTFDLLDEADGDPLGDPVGDPRGDPLEGRAERAVPAWSRDVLVPWGWNGQWLVGQRAVRQVQETGWPWPALASVATARVSSASGPTQWAAVDGYGAPIEGRADAFWPTHVLWPGLVADVSVHGLAWLAIFWGVRASRRRFLAASRRRRGRCPACAYPLRGARDAIDERCPECGARVVGDAVAR
jgi:hypothetical protein